VSQRERLIVVIMHVTDLERSLRFYRDLVGVPLEPGVNEPEDDPWYGGQHVELSWRDGAYLHFALFPARASEQPTTGAELGFSSDDVLAVHERMLAAAAPVLHAPRMEPWGSTARYRDPDGNIVGITQRLPRPAAEPSSRPRP
jgi:lactoylglutathione lyase